jgi:hypothetical protein
VFRPRTDVLMMHLSHPMVQRALSSLTRRRFPGSGDEVSRWTASHGPLPQGADAAVLLNVEELAVNELREMFHHWVRTIAFTVHNGELSEPLPHATARGLRAGQPLSGDGTRADARTVFEDVEADLKRFVLRHAQHLTSSLQHHLKAAGAAARKDEDERYRSRQGEVSALIADNTLGKLEREIARLQQERRQGLLFDAQSRLDEIERSIDEKREEIARRTRHYQEVRAQLERERERILGNLIPKRYTMSGVAQVFPVSLEIRLPA